MSKYFLDTEFIEHPGHIELISIGLVCDDGREFYMVNHTADLSQASEWVIKNVLEKMPEYDAEQGSGLNNRHIGKLVPLNIDGKRDPTAKWNNIEDIEAALLEFTGQVQIEVKFHNDYKERPFIPEECEFWGYYADYDWVIFCWIFGTMVDLPMGYPKYCHDLMQLIDENCIDLDEVKLCVPEDIENQHNALTDAKWIKFAYNLCTKYIDYNAEMFRGYSLKEFFDNSLLFNPHKD
jgi:hypothetical protein